MLPNWGHFTLLFLVPIVFGNPRFQEQAIWLVFGLDENLVFLLDRQVSLPPCVNS